jgi:hypothetical protein
MSQVETRNRATSSEEARKDVLKRVEKEGVESLDQLLRKKG